jgi:hypothetical protein
VLCAEHEVAQWTMAQQELSRGIVLNISFTYVKHNRSTMLQTSRSNPAIVSHGPCS